MHELSVTDHFPNSSSIMASALCTSLSICLTHMVSRHSLWDGLGTNKGLERNLVLLAGGVANCAAVLVLDLVCALTLHAWG